MTGPENLSFKMLTRFLILPVLKTRAYLGEEDFGLNIFSAFT